MVLDGNTAYLGDGAFENCDPMKLPSLQAKFAVCAVISQA
jgi:hypothetical protein